MRRQRLFVVFLADIEIPNRKLRSARVRKRVAVAISHSPVRVLPSQQAEKVHGACNKGQGYVKLRTGIRHGRMDVRERPGGPSTLHRPILHRVPQHTRELPQGNREAIL